MVLFDEIEKAHPDVFNLMLQVLDEGFMTDSLGRKIDFRNTIIIMTSNIGSRQLKDFGQGVGFITQSKKEGTETHNKSVIETALKRYFSPEFLNRLDDVIIFNQLEKEAILKILDVNLMKLHKRIEPQGFKLELTEAAKDFLCDKGYDPDYGARPLGRAIQKFLEDPIAEEMLKAEIGEGDVIKADFKTGDDELTIQVIKKKEKKKTKEEKPSMYEETEEVAEEVAEETEQLDEVSPPGMEKMTGSPRTKASFAKQYGKRGKEVMYATAWKQYNKKKAAKD